MTQYMIKKKPSSIKYKEIIGYGRLSYGNYISGTPVMTDTDVIGFDEVDNDDNEV